MKVVNRKQLKLLNKIKKVCPELKFRPRCILNCGLKIKEQHFYWNIFKFYKFGQKKIRQYKNKFKKLPCVSSINKLKYKKSCQSHDIISIVELEEENYNKVHTLTKDLEEFDKDLQNEMLHITYNDNQTLINFNNSEGNSTLEQSQNENVNSTENEILKVQSEKCNIEKNANKNHSASGQNFIDNLLQKICQNQGEDKISNNIKTPNLDTKPVTHVNINRRLEPSLLRGTQDDELSSNSSLNDFHGFNEIDELNRLDINKVDNVNDASSVFVSEKLNEYMKENLLENCSNITVPTKVFTYEDGMIYAESEMPVQLEYPEPAIRKFRTVAEKRENLQKKKSVKCLMVESESNIYWEYKRRQKDKDFYNFKGMRNIQNLKIPFRRGTWKTASWLATDKGKFYFLTFVLPSERIINFYGGKGNFERKSISLMQEIVPNKQHICKESCFLLDKFPNLKVTDTKYNKQALLTNLDANKTNYESIKTSHQHNKEPLLLNTIVRTKAGPLSNKIKELENEDVTKGSLEIFEVPNIQLEIWPKRDQQFNKNIKSYLKLVQPSENISMEWARFACSTLVSLTSTKLKPAFPTSFIFDLPFENNQNRIIVRRLAAPSIIKNEKINIDREIISLEEPLLYLDNIISSDDTNTTSEIVEYLKSMITSVGIHICQNALIKADPDLTYNQKNHLVDTEKNKMVPQVSIKDKKHIDKSKSRVLKELKRLNATFIESERMSSSVLCKKNDACKLGCVCPDSCSNYVFHCKKVSCMFYCKCETEIKFEQDVIIEDRFNNHEIRSLREKATASLAPVEKDFTSTLVLTNDETILIHNTQVIPKRNRKLPKSLMGYIVEEGEESEEKCTAKNQATLTHFNKTEFACMAHCSVQLERIDVLNGMAIWCMVHCLYNCLCGGRSIQGDPFSFCSNQLSLDSINNKSIENSNVTNNKLKFIEANIKINNSSNLILVDPTEVARRVMIVNVRKYKEMNRLRRQNVLKIIHREQCLQDVQIILKRRILDAAVGYKTEKLNELKNKMDMHKNISDILQKKTKAAKLFMKSGASYQKCSEVSNQNSACLPSSEECTAKMGSSQIKGSAVTFPTQESNDCSAESNGTSIEYKLHINNLNKIVTKAMTNMSEHQKTSSKYLSAPIFKRLINIRWECLVDAYTENIISAWEVNYTKDNKSNMLLAITESNKMPQIENAISIINVKSVSAVNELVSLMTKMLFSKFKHENIEKLGVLLFGQISFWNVVGFIHSNVNYMNDGVFVKPTPRTHPALSKKINSLNTIFVREIQSREVSKVNTNIEITEIITPRNSIFVPIPIIGYHRWFMLSITDDFSDIYIPSWQSFLKYDKIISTQEISKEANRTVSISPEDKKNESDMLKVLVVPNQNGKVFFGPYRKDQNINLVLCQEFNGQILLREKYEILLNIIRSNRTKGCWLYRRETVDTYLASLDEVTKSSRQKSNDIVFQKADDKKTEREYVNINNSSHSLSIATNKPSVTSILKSQMLPTEKPDITSAVLTIEGDKSTMSKIVNSAIIKNNALINVPRPGMSLLKPNRNTYFTNKINLKPIPKLKPTEKLNSKYTSLNSVIDLQLQDKITKIPPLVNAAINLNTPTSTKNLVFTHSILKKTNPKFTISAPYTIKNDQPSDICKIESLTKSKPSYILHERMLNTPKVNSNNTTVFSTDEQIKIFEPYSLTESGKTNKRQFTKFPRVFNGDFIPKNTSFEPEENISFLRKNRVKHNDETNLHPNIILRRKTIDCIETTNILSPKMRRTSIEDTIFTSNNREIFCVNKVEKEFKNLPKRKLLQKSNEIRDSNLTNITASKWNNSKATVAFTLKSISNPSLIVKCKSDNKQDTITPLNNQTSPLKLIPIISPQTSEVGSKTTKIINDGYLLSNIINLGKIKCSVLYDGMICAELPNKKITIRDISQFQKFMTAHIRLNICAIIPNTLEITWKMVYDSKDHENVDEMNEDSLNSNIVITECGSIDLRDKFETNEIMATNQTSTLMTKLMLLKLAKVFLNEKIDDSKWVDIIKKATHYIHSLKVTETVLCTTKKVLQENLQHREEKLRSLVLKNKPSNIKDEFLKANSLNESPMEPCLNRRELLPLHFNVDEVVVIEDDDC